MRLTDFVLTISIKRSVSIAKAVYALYQCNQGDTLLSYLNDVNVCVGLVIIETLRFLCLNERNVSLVAICAVI